MAWNWGADSLSGTWAGRTGYSLFRNISIERRGNEYLDYGELNLSSAL